MSIEILIWDGRSYWTNGEGDEIPAYGKLVFDHQPTQLEVDAAAVKWMQDNDVPESEILQFIERRRRQREDPI